MNDHTRNRVQWRVGYTNDPLDKDLENSMWIKENKKIHMTVMPGKSVNADEEFLSHTVMSTGFNRNFPFTCCRKLYGGIGQR